MFILNLKIEIVFKGKNISIKKEFYKYAYGFIKLHAIKLKVVFESKLKQYLNYEEIVYLTFYFTPDLCAGSFRNSSLAIELSRQAKFKNVYIDLYTTLPNRYSTFKTKAPEYEELDNLRIHRIRIPSHKSGMIDQALSFSKFYWAVKLNSQKK